MVECLNKSDQCSGPVEPRPSMTGTGTPIARCDLHYDRALERNAELRRQYPDSTIPPAWFDPADAGERWNDDD